jgi:DNA (cytosine-5)-methyltransferase 1
MKVLDLFSGIGGFSLGLERAGFETVAFCEVDKKCQAVLKKHWPNVPIFDDVSNLTGENIGQKVDVICGGFPCQDISLAGKGAGLAGKRSGLWSEFHRLIKEIKPKYAIIENVSALRSRGLDQVLREISEIGYDAEWHCITASSIGAPHRRDRIWIVAYANGEPSEQTDSESISKQSKRDSWMGSTGCSGRQCESSSNQEMADANDLGLQGRRKTGISENLGKAWSQFTGSGAVRYDRNVAHTDKFGTQISFEREFSSKQLFRGSSEARGIAIWNSWSVEPDVGRVANGIPGRVDRLKQLGNAVVPQIPQLLGMAIMEREKCLRG